MLTKQKYRHISVVMAPNATRVLLPNGRSRSDSVTLRISAFIGSLKCNLSRRDEKREAREAHSLVEVSAGKATAATTVAVATATRGEKAMMKVRICGMFKRCHAPCDLRGCVSRPVLCN